MLFNIISILGKKGVQLWRGRLSGKSQHIAEPNVCSLFMFLPMAEKGVSASTVENYRTAVRSFIRFCGKKDVLLSVISADMVLAYERWLHASGICPNTSSCYMRSLRAVYNKAVARRRVRDGKPFRKVFTGNDKTMKRSVSVEDIRKLQAVEFLAEKHLVWRKSRQSSLQRKINMERGDNMEVQNGVKRGNDAEMRRLEMARDLFLFSFYAMGMPFVDIAHLKHSQIKDGILTYCRRKTGRLVKVRLEKCMFDIIDKYATQQSEYVFPILHKVTADNPCRVSYAASINLYNRLLKTLACKIGVSERLTSYTARHTWASLAYRNNIDLSVISKALGHADTKATLFYISGIDDCQVAQANRKLLREILETPLGKRCLFL